MPLQLALPAAGQQKNLPRCRQTIWLLRFQFFPLHPLHHRVTDEFHAQRRHALGIPILLEREDAQQQIIILRQLVRAAGTRRPDLRRDELDDFRVPLGEGVFADVFFDRLTETQVEPAVIHADDHIRLALDGQRQQLVEQPPEYKIFFQNIRDADDRVLRQVERLFHAGGGHLGPACAEENRRGWRLAAGSLLAQRGNEFRRKQISARLAGDEHEGFRFHGLTFATEAQRKQNAIHFSKLISISAPLCLCGYFIC